MQLAGEGEPNGRRDIARLRAVRLTGSSASRASDSPHIIARDIEEVGRDVGISSSQYRPRPVDSPLDKIGMTYGKLPNC